jgi:hypothetical protein
MKFYLALTLFVLSAFCSCGQMPNNLTYTNSEKVALSLIQLCVDSTLQSDQGLNTGQYTIDFSATKELNRQGIDRFLKLNPNATETNLDSLVLHDTIWIKYQFFQNPVIRFDKIKEQPDGTILINTSKTKASDGSIGTEIIIQKQGDSFKCISTKITWIS